MVSFGIRGAAKRVEFIGGARFNDDGAKLSQFVDFDNFQLLSVGVTQFKM